MTPSTDPEGIDRTEPTASDLVAFLRARLDEREQSLHDAGQGRIAWLTYRNDEGRLSYTTVASGSEDAEGPDDEWAADGKDLATPASVHVVFDQAHELVEVETKRRIIADLIPVLDSMDHQIGIEGVAATMPGHFDHGDGACGGTCHMPEAYARDQLLKRLALPYADHPDYREDWRP